MARRQLIVTQHQAEALLRAAEKEGGVAEVVKDGVTIRLVPSSLVDRNRAPDSEKARGYL